MIWDVLLLCEMQERPFTDSNYSRKVDAKTSSLTLKPNAEKSWDDMENVNQVEKKKGKKMQLITQVSYHSLFIFTLFPSVMSVQNMGFYCLFEK